MAALDATDGASAPLSEYQSSDQFDLAQAKPAVHRVSSPIQSLDTHLPVDPSNSTTSTPNIAPEHSLSDLPLSAPLSSTLEQQTQSRSMSRASSSAASTSLDIVTDAGRRSPASLPRQNDTSESTSNGLSVPSSALTHVPDVVDPSNVPHSDSAVQGDALSSTAPEKISDANMEALEGITPHDSPVPSIAHIKSPSLQAASTSTTLPKARLPHDTIGILEDRIKDDPRGDIEAWLALIEEHKKRGKTDEARAAYERFLALFPTAAEAWLSYAQMENAVPDNRSGVSKVLGKSLMEVPSLAIWSFYIDHVRRYQNLITEPDASRKTIHQAFDLALRTVGLDKDSGRLWQDYILFIKSGPGILGGSNWQDSQKMDLLRKTYQRAICVPTQATNTIWKEYDAFEMGLNKTTGRKFLQDQSPMYMSARSCYTELQNITRDLQRTTFPSLPPAPGFEGDIEFTTQLNTWKRWIEWERNDPLVLKQDDMESYKARVTFVYKQSVMALRFWPEIWSDASEFCFANDLIKEGNDFLTQGITANPESCLLAFKRADRLELTTPNDEADDKQSRRAAVVREPYDKVLNSLYDLIAKTKAREDVDVARIQAQLSVDSAPFQADGMDEKQDGEEDPNQDEITQKSKQIEAQIEAVKNLHAAQTKLLSQTLSHVWIALMRAMRRIQGKGGVNGGGARGVFSEARKRGRITPDVYVQAALIEFHCYDPDTGKKIFDRGLKLFPEDESFALEYIQHLVAINDHTNARVVFETVVTRLAQKPSTVMKAKPLYLFFHNFESRYGELTQIIKLEKRMRDLFPQDPALALFAKRYTSNGIDPTVIRPIVSPAKQMKPKVLPDIQASVAPAPTPRLQLINSPKRPLPSDTVDDEVDRPRKIQRGESPMKPVIPQPMIKSNSQQHHTPVQNIRPPIPAAPYPLPPLPRDVSYLLSIIPKADTYQATKFDPGALVRLIRETNIPTHMSQLPQSAAARIVPPPSAPPQTPHLLGPPQPYHQHGAVPPMQQRPGLPPMPQVQHGPPMGYPPYGQQPAVGPYVYGH